MKHISKSLILLLATISATILYSQDHSTQQRMLPVEFKKLWFGMSLAEFQKKQKKKVAFLGQDLMEFRVEGKLVKAKGKFKEVVYYFDNEGNKPFYEIIIEYIDQSSRNADATKYLGEPNDGDQWVFDSGEGFKIKAWIFENKLVYAAMIKGTEWEEEN